MVGAGEGGGGAASLSYDPKLVNLPAPAPAPPLSCTTASGPGSWDWSSERGHIMKVRSNNYAASGVWCLVCGGGVVFAKMTGHRSLIEYSDPRLAAAQPRTGMGTTHRLQATGSTRQRTLKPLDLTDF